MIYLKDINIEPENFTFTCKNIHRIGRDCFEKSKDENLSNQDRENAYMVYMKAK